MKTNAAASHQRLPSPTRSPRVLQVGELRQDEVQKRDRRDDEEQPEHEAPARDLHARHRLVEVVLLLVGLGWVDLGA